MSLATRKIRIAVPLLIAASATLLTVNPASAGGGEPGLFTINHYMVYTVMGPSFEGAPVTLEDQFGVTENIVESMNLFGVPVTKNFEGILDPFTHLTWRRLSGELPILERDVVVRNQFGEYTIRVRGLEWLLSPAVKNPQPDEQPRRKTDHYKCYTVIGPSVDVFVLLEDQFAVDTTIVSHPIYLCNPTKKNHPDGRFSNINNPTEHLVCYAVDDPSIMPFGGSSLDQFQENQFALVDRKYLCVPSEKEEAVQIEGRSWGKVKSIYR